MAARVLVVDDSMIVRKAVEKMLGDKVEIVSVDSAATARASIVKQRPTLIISDVIMPQEDGFSFSRSVKRHSKLKNIPILLMSGVVDKETQQQARAAGAIGVLKKPFSSEELQKTVAKIFTQLRKRQQQRLAQQKKQQQQAAQEAAVARAQPAPAPTEAASKAASKPASEPTSKPASKPAVSNIALSANAPATSTLASIAAPSPAPPTTTASPKQAAAATTGAQTQKIPRISPQKAAFEFSGTQINQLNEQLQHILTSANAGCVWLFSAGVAVTEVGHSATNAQDLLIFLYLMRESALMAGKELKLSNLHEATFEYDKHTLLIHTVHSQDNESMFIVMLLDENGALSMARYVLRKALPTIHNIIGQAEA